MMNGPNAIRITLILLPATSPECFNETPCRLEDELSSGLEYPYQLEPSVQKLTINQVKEVIAPKLISKNHSDMNISGKF